jgi:hypothetical protein
VTIDFLIDAITLNARRDAGHWDGDVRVIMLLPKLQEN